MSNPSAKYLLAYSHYILTLSITTASLSESYRSMQVAIATKGKKIGNP
jgi:hypothetical protein